MSEPSGARASSVEVRRDSPWFLLIPGATLAGRRRGRQGRLNPRIRVRDQGRRPMSARPCGDKLGIQPQDEER